jgi:hypothetical protein
MAKIPWNHAALVIHPFYIVITTLANKSRKEQFLSQNAQNAFSRRPLQLRHKNVSRASFLAVKVS